MFMYMYVENILWQQKLISQTPGLGEWAQSECISRNIP